MDFLRMCKTLIDKGQLDALKSVYEETDFEGSAWEDLYVKLYTHACLRGQKEIAGWLKGLHAGFNPMQQIALRQAFAYGDVLLRKH